MKPRRTKAPLDARSAAFLTLRDTAGGRFPEEALEERAAGLSPRERGLAHHLVLGVLRYRGRLDYVLGRFLSRPDRPLAEEVRDILRLGAFQLIYLDRVPASAAVNESVNLAKRYGPGWSASLVNAVLRAMTRAERLPDPEDDDLPPVQKLALSQSYPEWIVRRLLDRFGPEETRQILEAGNEIAPLTLWVNTRRTTAADLAARLADWAERVEPTPYAPDGLRVFGAKGAVARFPGFAEGLFLVQDEASQAATLLARPENSGRVLDACAGLGGKALHLALASEGAVTAMDPDPGRLGRLRLQADRLGPDRLSIVRGDLLAAPFREAAFEAVLVDAPCSNLGAIRRRPDVKWLQSAQDPARQAEAQIKLLSAAARLVKPGGRLIYSVCTFTLEETTGVVEALLARRPNMALASAAEALPESARGLVRPDGLLEAWPHRHGADGFFAALFRKKGVDAE